MSGRVTTAQRQQGVLRTSAALAIWVMCGTAAGADLAEPMRYRIEQPAQPLSESLLAIARQTGVSVVFDPRVVGGRTSPSVVGQLSGTEAILRAVNGTGMSAAVQADGSVVVSPTSASARPGSSAASRPMQVSMLGPNAAGDSPQSPVQSAQATSDGEPVPVSPAPATSGEPQLQRIEVTGSRLKRIDAEGPLPVNVYRREDIERSGQPNLERFLSSLNEASVSPGEGAFGSTFGQGAVQLRGLPLGSTLVLVNGRRVEAVGSSDANIFNLSLIPLAAVERVEILPVGSSAVYGGDALAGVVNIILKKSIDGVSLDASIGSARGTNDGSLSVATGGQDQDGSYLLLGSFSKASPLYMGERSFFRDMDYRRFGGTDARSQECTPGTVSSTTDSNLPGLNSSTAGIPRNASGSPLTSASFSATAGQPNLCSVLANGNGFALSYKTETASVHAAGERRLSDVWSVFGELTHVRDRLSADETGIQLRGVTVPETNAYNPFGVPVNVTARLGPENGLTGLSRDTQYTRALLGLRGNFVSGWDFESVLSTSRDSSRRLILNDTTNFDALDAALASSSPAQALNPFATGRAAGDDVLRGIWSDTESLNHGRKDQISALLRGSLVDLPAGSVEAVLGAEYGVDRYSTAQPGAFGFDIAHRRNVSAIYAEARVPLLRGGQDQAQTWNMAALTLAGRRDRYSDFGSANTYQAGIEFRPMRTVLLRGGVATSFKPPTLLETGYDAYTFGSDTFGLTDPAKGNQPVTTGQVVFAPNPNLKPETGRALSLGAMWEPQAGSRIGVNLWRVKIDGLIGVLQPQVALDNESLFPGFVTRSATADGAPGDVERILVSQVNFGSVDTAGADIDVAHAWNAFGGKWTAGASATRAIRYDVVLAPGVPAEDRLGRRAIDFWAPKWKGRLGLDYDAGAWGLGVASRYLGAYSDIGASDSGLGNMWLHDFSGRVDLKRLGALFASMKSATLMVSVANAFNRQPQFVQTYPYYDVTQADWRGRYASLRLSVGW